MWGFCVVEVSILTETFTGDPQLSAQSGRAGKPAAGEGAAPLPPGLLGSSNRCVIAALEGKALVDNRALWASFRRIIFPSASGKHEGLVL